MIAKTKRRALVAGGLLMALGVTCGIAMPSDYLNEATDLVSAEELNVLYGSIPHRRGVDKFKIHSSYRKSDTTKYYILSKRHEEVPQKTVFIIASTTTTGCFIHSKSDEVPFENGLIPKLTLTMPVEDLHNLYKASEGVEFVKKEGAINVSPETEEIIDELAQGVGQTVD